MSRASRRYYRDQSRAYEDMAWDAKNRAEARSAALEEALSDALMELTDSNRRRAIDTNCTCQNCMPFHRMIAALGRTPWKEEEAEVVDVPERTDMGVE